MHLPDKVNPFCWKSLFTCWENIHTWWWACWGQVWQGQSHSTQAGHWQASTTSAEGWPVRVASHPYPEPSNEFLKSAFHCSKVPVSIARSEMNLVYSASRDTFAPEHSHSWQAFNCCMADYHSCTKFQCVYNSAIEPRSRRCQIMLQLTEAWRGRQSYQEGCSSWHYIKSLIYL